MIDTTALADELEALINSVGGRCLDPHQQEAQFVTRDTAIGAGEPTTEGTMLRGKLWDSCQVCEGCFLRNNAPAIIRFLRAGTEMEPVVAKVASDGCCFEYEEFGECRCVFRSDVEQATQALNAWREAGRETGDKP